MQEIRKTIDRTVFGLILYTLLRYAVFAAEPLARKCWVWLTIPDSSRRQEVLTQLNSSASGSGVSSIAAVCVGVLFLGWYFRKSTPPGKLFSQRQPLPLKGFLLLSCIFMGAQLIYSLFGNSLELLLRLFGYTAMGQLDAASAQSTTLSMFLYTAVFAPVGEELIYRGLVMPQFQRYGKVLPFVTSALLFGVMHANLFQMPFAFLTGLCWATQRRNFRSAGPFCYTCSTTWCSVNCWAGRWGIFPLRHRIISIVASTFSFSLSPHSGCSATGNS